MFPLVTNLQGINLLYEYLRARQSLLVLVVSHALGPSPYLSLPTMFVRACGCCPASYATVLTTSSLLVLTRSIRTRTRTRRKKRRFRKPSSRNSISRSLSLLRALARDFVLILSMLKDVCACEAACFAKTQPCCGNWPFRRKGGA